MLRKAYDQSVKMQAVFHPMAGGRYDVTIIESVE
jgi:hypothetical protein